MHDLWLRACARLNVDPATVKMPHIFVTQPDLIYVFSGDRRSYGPALYVPTCNTIMVTPDYDIGHIKHEFAEAVVYQSPEITFKDTEDYAKDVEQNI